MSASKHTNHWRALFGALAVSGLALGLSLRLEGAAHVPGGLSGQTDPKIAVSADEAKRAIRATSAQRLASAGEPVAYGNLADMMSGNVPTFPVIKVDYRDDEATRMREAGLLDGPLPMSTREGGVALGGCSFNVDCDDGNRCTRDVCDFTAGQPAGSGICENTVVPNGQDGANGDTECPVHFGLACGGCDDGIFCNGPESCTGGVCVAGTPPCSGIQVCSETFDLCQAQSCGSPADCSNATVVGAAFADVAALRCNGVETCAAGVCIAGTNPCGSGGLCSERKCSVGPLNTPCVSDEDCAAVGGSCSNFGPICSAGRCCVGATEPACSRRTKRGVCGGLTPGTQGGAACSVLADCAGRFCVGGTNDDNPCTGGGDCPGGACPAASGACGGVGGSCDGLGGTWYGHDDGTIIGTGTNCPVLEDVQVRCPKFGAGIAPSGPFTNLGPISDSAIVVAPFGVPLQKLGDDYTLSNPGVCVGGGRAGLGCGVNADCPGSNNCNLAGPSYIALDYLRFAGGSPATDRIAFELYDESGNLIEDLFFSGTSAFGIYPVQFDPPLIVPAKGFIVQRVASNFAPSARHVWSSTNAVDVGTNDSNKLWVNAGPTGSNFGTSGILAFELEGDKVQPNVGACCRTNPDVCENAQLPWVCKGTGGVYLGNVTACAQCDAGGSAGQYCRRCSNNTALTCNKDSDCGAGTCSPFNGACPDGVCVAEPACAEGGCCDPATGACTVEMEASCSPPRTYLGNGSTCDASQGAYGTLPGNIHGEQHCCPQPTITGADDCLDVTLHVITAPPLGETKVLTISGNNSTASNEQGPNEDSCFDFSEDVGSEPGWWEGFTLVDDCTVVYVDLCCTEPVHRPAYSIIYDACPCGSATFSVSNPYKFPEPPFNRGLPYCKNDDNLWQSFGLLGPGPYYYPIYSVLQGNHGDYQMHVIAQACPRAACCVQNQCVNNVTQFECDDLGGFFLAPPQKSPTIASCSGTNGQPGSTCFNGSCCTGPGECIDTQVGQLMTLANCNSASGNFVGNVRCEGGTCSATTIESCNDAADCPLGESCLGGAQAIAQQSPCPICEIEGVGNCQPFDNTLNFALSDRALVEGGSLLADDIKPDGDILSSVCVWGLYLNHDPNATTGDCGLLVTADHFRVRLFANDPATGRSPGALVATRDATSEKGIVIGSLLQARNIAEAYGYQLVLDSPITGLTIGATYWLEVSNDVTESAPTCFWRWCQQAPTATSLAFTGNETGYDSTFVTPNEQVFCTNFTFAPSTTGAAVGSCCTCDGVCTLKTVYDCDNLNGIWGIDHTTCAGVVCQDEPPPNDNCGDEITLTTGSYVVHNQCATTDGYGPIPSDYNEEGAQIDFDMWYKFIAPSSCELIVSQCQTGVRFDSMFAVYSNCPPGSPPNCDKTICPPCALEADPNGDDVSQATLTGVGQDESCQIIAIAGPGLFIGSTEMGRNAVPGECFLLRVGSFPGSRGTASLDISCGSPGGPAGPVIPETNALCTGPATPTLCCTGSGAGTCDKTRFISFTPPSGSTGETALRVKLTSLHHPVPNYTNGATIIFSAFENKELYVGPPNTYIESGANPTPYTTANLQCAPYYRDWNTVGLLHVTGSGIVPSSTYRVEHLASSCLGVEGSGACVSGGASVSTQAEIKTTRWADVVPPYTPPAAGEPSFADVTALVAKFRSQVGSPIKARALILGNDASGRFNTSTLSADLNFSHIASCVDAFRGTPYPFKMGKCTGNPTPPASGACTTTSECTGNNGAGPCILDEIGVCTGAPTPPATGQCRWSSQCTGTNGAGPCIISNCAP